MGAKLHASPASYRIYAPSTHSLPVIKSVAGIDDYAEIELRSCSNGLYHLKHLSSLYHRIWNSKNTVTDRDPLVGRGRRSFSVVRHIVCQSCSCSLLIFACLRCMRPPTTR